MVYTQLQRQARPLAVLGKVPDAGSYSGLGRLDLYLPSLQLHPAGVYGIGAEDRPRELRAPSPNQAREAEDLAGSHLKRAVLEDIFTRNTLNPQEHLPYIGLRLGVEIADLAAN